MTSDTFTIQITVESPDRRGLVARLCAELGHALARDERWERDDVIVPWHASAPTFAELPRRIVGTVIDEWDEVDARLAGVEFSGYLETDAGPRAWGCLMVHEGRPRASRPRIESLTVNESAGGCRLEARLRTDEGAGGADV